MTTQIFNTIRDAKWWILHRFHPQHRYNVLHTGLKPGYYDPEDQILYATMEAVRRFVDQAGPQIDWFGTPDHQEAWEHMCEIYDWWVNQYPQFEVQRDRLYEQWDNMIEKDSRGKWKLPLTSKQGMEDNVQRILDDIEQLDQREETESRAMLIKVAEVRPFLWYP